MQTIDRRVNRTRDLLQKSLIELISERNYDSITIRDVVNRANVGRTTFYVHFKSKDDLFISCHETILSTFQSGSFYPHPLSRADLLASEAPQGMRMAFHHLEDARSQLYPIFQGKDGSIILRRIRDRTAREIESNLLAVFDEADSKIPFDLLAIYISGAQIALMQWWLEKRQPYSVEKLTNTFHRLQRAAVLDALGLQCQDK